MTDTTITRRRVVQGIGTVGLTGVVGGPVAAQEQTTETATGTATDGEAAAIRVAHAVADAPAVDVRLRSEGADGGSGESTETATNESTETATTESTETATNESTETATNESTGTTAASGDELTIDRLDFGEVSNYQAVASGSYHLQIVAVSGGLLDQILDIFDGSSDEETVIYDEPVELEAGSTYTAVAFGELAAGPPGEPTPTETETETSADGAETETESDGGAADSASLTVTSGRNLEVELLEDDLSAPGEGMARLRVFHAVPDADEVTITAEAAGGDTGTETGTATGTGTETGTEATGTASETVAGAAGTETAGGTGTETPAATGTETAAATGTETAVGDGGTTTGQTLVESLSFGEAATVEVEAGQYTLSVQPVSGTDGTGVDGASSPTPTDTNQTEVGTATEAGMGETATGANATESPTQTETPGNVTETGTAASPTPSGTDAGVRTVDVSLDAGAVYSGFAVGYFDPDTAAGRTLRNRGGGNESAGRGTDTGTETGTETTGQGSDDERTRRVRNRDFELVTVKDSQDGERTEGGNRGLL